VFFEEADKQQKSFESQSQSPTVYESGIFRVASAAPRMIQWCAGMGLVKDW